MTSMRRLKMFEHASEQNVKEVTGSVDWVVVSNGDESRSWLRGRLVVKKTWSEWTLGPQDAMQHLFSQRHAHWRYCVLCCQESCMK